MSVLQHYYTSFVNRENGSAGFQVKAMSPGIPVDIQSIISRLIAYRIPPTLTEYDISRHPVALRYYYEGVHRSILLCSQSNGSDENGRPGNFFAHSLVLEPDKFKRVPPILYWRSPFWRTRDTGTSTSITPLPSFDEEPALDIENVWSFLAQDRRIEYFQKLMSAVVYYNTSHRRIVIIDTSDNVAMWIAAISCMLPPDYRPMLSFATYHHDPYQAQFLITGTTTDSSFRASAEEYMSFFILNAETGKISDIENSPYAEEATIAARSIDDYETRLLPLFMSYSQRFPAPTCIDEQLDQMVRYARVLNPSQQMALTSHDLQAIHTVLTVFEQSNNFSREDLLELNRLGITLSNAYETQSQLEQAIYTEYNRIVALQKKHKMPTDEAAMNDLKRFTQRLVRDGNLEQVMPRLNNYRQTYGEEMFFATVNNPDYLQWLYQLLKGASVQQLADVWTALGASLRMDSRSSRVLVSSLRMLGTLKKEGRAKEGTPLLKAIVTTTTGREQEVLQLAVASYTDLPPETLESFYCRYVSRFDLGTRVTYRAIVQRVCSDINVYELRYEVQRGGVENGLAALEQWIEHAKQQRMASLPFLIDNGLASLQSQYKRMPQQWYDLVPAILTSKVLEPLPQNWEDQLVDTALSQVSLSKFSPIDIKMCKKYQNRRGLSVETRTIIDGLLAMESGELDADLADRLRKRFMSLSPDAYQEEANRFIGEFLGRCVSKEAHNGMVNMIFTWKLADYFWNPYWETFSEILTRSSAADQVIQLLTYWFTTPPETFKMPYTAHYFFLNLPQKLEEAQKARSFQNVVRQINSLSERQKPRWYPLVQDYFTGRKNVFVSVGQSLAGQFQKRLGSQNAEEEARIRAEQKEKEEFDGRIASLFEGKKLRQSHKQNLLAVYPDEQLERFWASYWEKFTLALLTSEADAVLELLAFWFDESFETLLRMHEIPQGFFLGLSEALDAARKERGFRDRARQISAKGMKSNQAYPWYPVVQDYFVEQERRFPSSGVVLRRLL